MRSLHYSVRVTSQSNVHILAMPREVVWRTVASNIACISSCSTCVNLARMSSPCQFNRLLQHLSDIMLQTWVTRSLLNHNRCVLQSKCKLIEDCIAELLMHTTCFAYILRYTTPAGDEQGSADSKTSHDCSQLQPFRQCIHPCHPPCWNCAKHATSRSGNPLLFCT